ncbi:MAG: ATP-binding cassette domain-containing protein [Luteimonas sp.]|nr:ATP-binding cassette domain-containing protein [Luteimonas sp.]
MTNAFALSGVCKHYEDFALKDITLSMPVGQVMGLVGVNGAGKTTMLRILSGLAQPDSGTVEVLGYSMPDQQVAAKKELGFEPEDIRLVKTQTVRWHMHLLRAIDPERD